MTLQEATEKLFQAARTGDVAAAIAALDAGADVNARDRSLLRTPLHLAATHEHTDIARLLIERGADLSARTANGDTPLHWAAYYGHTDFARLLIENGADVNAKDEDQRTPLHYAVDGGHYDLLKVLADAAKQQQGHASRVEKQRGIGGPQIGD